MAHQFVLKTITFWVKKKQGLFLPKVIVVGKVPTNGALNS
jgi:hypothetical protein